ncbi:MAG: peptidase [Deltaproteobacteria bacterium]|nr:peptidase [Deltaproteobacteria bacterium]
MTRWTCTTLLAAALVATTAACKPKTQPKGEEMPTPEEPEVTPEVEKPTSQFAAWERIQKQLTKFEQYKLEWSRGPLTDGHRAMLKELFAAADLMDEMFLRQVSRRNVQLRVDLERSDDPGKEDIAHYFRIMFGPYDRLDHNRPFINVPRKLKGATFYPANMDKAEFEKWIEEHPGDEQAFRAPFTVLTRTKEKRLAAVPYSEHYKEWLEPAAAHLRTAASHAENESLKTFLESRAEAFGSNDYFRSDMDWVNVKDHVIDVTIGPYEVYEDELLGYKAAFEAYICIRDPERSAQLEEIKNHLPEMESNLPIPEEHQNKNRGAKSPVAVVDLIYSAGDAKAGVQTLAFNLPNDEKVREHKNGGAKKVILRNMMHGKYDVIMKRIAPIVTAEDQAGKVTFEQFFNHTLMHEISHSVGPGTIVKEGEKTEVSKEIKELYPTIEEAKADTLGMYNSIFLIEKGYFPEDVRENIWVTFMAGTFRSVRFGANEAHGKANVIIFNYLVEKGAYIRDEQTGKFAVEFDKIEAAVKDLAHDLLMLEALGDYEGSKAFIEKYGTMSKDMKALVDQVNEADIPVDIEPIFDIDDIK